MPSGFDVFILLNCVAEQTSLLTLLKFTSNNWDEQSSQTSSVTATRYAFSKQLITTLHLQKQLKAMFNRIPCILRRVGFLLEFFLFATHGKNKSVLKKMIPTLPRWGWVKTDQSETGDEKGRRESFQNMSITCCKPSSILALKWDRAPKLRFRIRHTNWHRSATAHVDRWDACTRCSPFLSSCPWKVDG